MRLLSRVADLVLDHPRAVGRSALLIVLLGALATAWGAMHLQTDYLALLPRHKPEVRVFRETIRDFGSLDYLLLVLEAPAGHGADEYEPLLEALAEAVHDSPHVQAVEYKVDTDSPLVDFMASKSLLFLAPAEREELERKLGDAAIREQVARNRQILMTPSSSVMKNLVKLDPLGLLQVVKGHFVSGRSSYGIDLSQGYYLSHDQSSVLIIVKPTRPAQDVNFDVMLMQDVERRCAQVVATEKPEPAPTIHFGGGYVVALEDYKILRRDAFVNLSTAFVSVLLLFAFGVGRLRAIKYAAVPLLAGILLTGGCGALILGSFNPATAGFAALLVGLAIDYVIVMYGRFSEERKAGRELHAAIRTLIEQTGKSVFLGAITSAATFLALCTVDFKGLFDLGFLTGIGVLLCFASIVVLVPLMLLADGEKHHETFARPVRSLGVEKLAAIPRRFPRATLVVTGVVTLAAIVTLPRVRFDDDLKALRARGNRGIEVQSMVSKRFGGGFDYMMVITHGRDLEELLARNVVVNHDLDALVEQGELAAYDSAVKYLPPREVQEQNLAWLRQRRGDSMAPARIRTTFEEALRHDGFRVDAFTHAIERLERALSVDAPLTPDTLRANDLGFVVDRYLRPEPAGQKSVTYVFPKTGDFKRNVPTGLARLAAGHPFVELSGVTVLAQTLRGEVKRQSIFALALGLVLVVILLYLDLRRALLTGLVMVPLVVGVLWMCGAMWVLGVSFNFFNVFVATMILGIGVDYGIHATHRFLEGNGADFEGAFYETGRSIVMAALTTMLGFGSFATSHYRGLYSMGMVAIIGTSTCVLACFTVLPALLTLWRPAPLGAPEPAPGGPPVPDRHATTPQ